MELREAGRWALFWDLQDGNESERMMVRVGNCGRIFFMRGHRMYRRASVFLTVCLECVSW